MLSVKDQMVTKTAIDLEEPENLVDLLIMWVYKDAKEATRKYRNVEISGFGKFEISTYRTKKRITLMDRTIHAENINPKKLQSAIETKTYYETKL